jgi:hypothetical protein
MENRPVVKQLSMNYMIAKLKILSVAALATVAAVTTARAAAAPSPVTSATVWNAVTVQYTVFSPESPNYLSTNKAKTVITATTQQSALSTPSILEALAATTGDSFDPHTSKLVTSKSYTDTNVYTVVVTESGKKTTNYYTDPVFAGLSNVVEVTIATNWVFTNASTQLQVVDSKGVVYPLTNGNVTFSFNAYTANASVKATNGVPITGTTAGTEYGAGAFSVNSPSNWVFSSSGFGTATMSSTKLGVGTNGLPIYVDLRNSSSAVYGSGYMGGTVVNGVPTNETEVLVKGTLTETFWKVNLNP